MQIYHLLLLSLFAGTLAHMPSFEEGHIGDVFDKSWGVYAELGASGARLFEFDCEAGRTLYLSLSKPVGSSGSAGATIRGLNATCATGFNGWGRRLDTALAPVAQDVHFEPFGVGGYVSLAACETTCPDSDHYDLVIEGTPGMPFSIGAGMTESFTPAELVMMSFHLANVFAWSGQSPLWVSGPILGTLLFSGLATVWRNLTRVATPWRLLALVAAVGLRVSAGVFAAQLVYLAGHGVPFGDMLAVPLVAHIGLPLLLSALVEWRARAVLRETGTRVLLGAIGLYSLFAIWQGYLVPAVALFLSAIVPFKSAYARVTP